MDTHASNSEPVSYTFADLLRDLQKLKPEQLAQQARAWGEHPFYFIQGVEVAAEDYVTEDGEAWPVSDAGEVEEDYNAYVEKGTVWLDTK